jgi:serine/threonine-protein kinase
MVVAGYRILERLSGGGAGDVYRARHERSGRDVALKILRRAPGGRPPLPPTGEPLRHPNVVAVLDSGVGEHGSWVAMEYLEGADLRRVLARRQRLDVDSALAVFLPVLAALGSAHDQGRLHGDLKPENVFVARTEGGEPCVKVLDFACGSPRPPRGHVAGTAAYLSPEQASGEPTDARSDLFAAGVLLYELLTGRPPFQAQSAVATAYRIVHAPAPRLEDPMLADVVERALAKDPSQRYPRAADFAAVLAARAPDAGVTAAALSGLATP